MAAYYESMGTTICDELEKFYEKYGFYLEGIESFTLTGKDGIEKMATLMTDLRENVKDKILDKKVKTIKDFYLRKEKDMETGTEKDINLPVENVIQFILEDNTYITARPSGTEPKIKFYFSVNDKSEELVNKKLSKTMKDFTETLKL